MPNAFDRRIPADDMSPLRVLNWDDIRTTALTAGAMMRDYISQAAQNIEELIRGILRETGVNLYTLFYDIAHAITGRTDELIDLDTVLLWSHDLRAMLANPPDWSTGDIDVMAWAIRFIETVLFPTGLLSGITEPLKAWLTPLVPVGSVGWFFPNLLANPNYAGSAAVDGGGIWIWDGGTDHDGDGSGSVYVTANGTLRQLLSDPAVPVAPGQELTCSHWLQWGGLAGAGETMSLGVAAYDAAGALVGTSTVARILDPPVSSAWAELRGVYSVPPDPTTVTQIRLQLVVTPAATAGTVHWDSASITKTHLFEQTWTRGKWRATLADDLTSFRGDFDTLTDETRQLVDSIVNAIQAPALPVAGVTVDAAAEALRGLTGAIAEHAQSIASLTVGSRKVAAQGAAVAANFGDAAKYPDGPLPAGLWGYHHAGPGSSTFGVDRGAVRWDPRADGDATDLAVWLEATDTDYQLVGMTVSGGPGYYTAGLKTSTNRLMARVDNPHNPQNYVYADITTNGLMVYYAELGVVRAGVTYPWPGKTRLPLALPVGSNLWLSAGTAAGLRSHALLVGTQPIVTHTEAGNESNTGAGFRYWGFGGIHAGGAIVSAPAPVQSCSVADCSPPAVKPGNLRAWNSTPASSWWTLGAGYAALGADFWPALEYRSDDIVWSGGVATVSLPGTYLANVRYVVHSMIGGGRLDPLIYQGASPRKCGEIVSDRVTGLAADGVSGTALLNMRAGDTVTPGVWCSHPGMAIKGDSGYSDCYFELALVSGAT